MWATRNKRIVIILIGALVVVGVVVGGIKAGQNNTADGIDTVTVSSPFSHNSMSVVPYYKADYTPGGKDAVDTTYTVFALNTLKVADPVKSALQYGVPAYLKAYQAPNVEPVFIHLDTNSLNYKNANDFSFNFYTDSPEGYFSYTVTPLDNNQSDTTILPIGGGW